jgi:uncharacterized protein (UPF0548 family)
MAELHIVARADAPDLLDRLRKAGRNFDPQDLDVAEQGRVWHVDHYRCELPSEPPGEPLPVGPWATACALSTGYEFVDPSIVRAFFDPSEPFEHRTLLLKVHFWGLRIYVGVRVGETYDVTRGAPEAPERVRGWGYDTLDGHFEKGRIRYEVVKRLDTGRVEFRIDARSRRANSGNLLVDAGFLLFGRRKQIEFARNGCARMARLTRARLEASPSSANAP